MMQNLRKSFLLFVFPLLLASCNKSNTLEVALGEFHTCQPVARVSLAFKTERNSLLVQSSMSISVQIKALLKIMRSIVLRIISIMVSLLFIES